MGLVDDFKIKFPEFSDEDIDRLIPLIPTAKLIIKGDYEKLNDYNKELTLYLLAHMLYTSGDEGSSGGSSLGTVSNYRVRDVSVSYNTNYLGYDFNDAFFSGSKYGKMYLFLLRNKTERFYVI